MSPLVSHGRAKYLTGRRLGSNRDGDWQQLLAERWHHEPGDLGAVEPRDTEVVVMVRGGPSRVRRRGDGHLQDHVVGPGSVWLCPAGIREDMIRVYGSIGETVHMYIPAEPLARGMLEDTDIDPARVRLRYDGGFRDPLIEQIALAVQREMHAPGPGGRLLIDTLSAALAAHIVRHHSNLTPANVELAPARGALGARRLHAVLDYVEAHLARHLTLDELAAVAGLSAFHFARAFKAATGRTPHAHVTERRLARARQMLADRDAPLVDVALACGFSSQAHFTRAFKQATGLTPGAWRATSP